jgi:hypothetical protein
VLISPRMTDLIARNLGDDAGKVLDAVAAVDASVIGVQDPDRMAAAIALLVTQGVDLDIAVEALHDDWRDLLMDAGLQDDDWPSVVAREFESA